MSARLQAMTEPARPPLPDRAPRGYWVHAAVDAVIAFGLIFMIGIIAGLEWQLLLMLAMIVGLIAAPFTQRLEESQLAARRARLHRAELDSESGPPRGDPPTD